MDKRTWTVPQYRVSNQIREMSTVQNCQLVQGLLQKCQLEIEPCRFDIFLAMFQEMRDWKIK